MEIYKVIWKNKEVGQLINPIPDMLYLEGDFISNETPESRKFQELIMSLDVKQVFLNHKTGVAFDLKSDTERYIIKSIGISLSDNKLFLRRILKRDNTIKRILKFLRLR